jgi:hypothetical protein
VTKLDHPLDGIRCPLEHCLDAPIGTVLYPPVDTAVSGPVTRRRPEVNALDFARDVDVCSRTV